MMNCHQATRLMSQAQERPLSIREKMVLRFHQSMCAGCRRFEGQVGFLRQASRQFTRQSDSSSGQKSEDKQPRK